MKRRRNKILKKLFLLWSMILAICFSFSALAAQESEDNGTFGRADVISLGEKVTGNVSTPGDEDFFKFTVSKKGKITIKEYYLRPLDYDGFDSTTLHLYDGSRRVIYEQKDDAMTSQSISVTPGTYYVRVSQCGMYGSKVPYGFKISFSEGKGTYRIDDFSSFQKARTIGVGSKVYGNIAASTECDYYKFTLPQAGIVDLTGARAVSGDNYLLWKYSLYNAKKEKIDAGMDYRNKVRVGLPAGTYYIKVTRGEKWSKKKYYLMVEYKKTGIWEKELNDTFDKSTPISLNSYVYGSMNIWSDVDCYTFTMPEDGIVKFDLSMDRDIYYVTLYSSNYRQSSGRLISSATDWDDRETTPTVSLKKGKYYLKINVDYLMGDPESPNYHFRVRTSVQPASIKLNKTSVTLSIPATTTAQLSATVTGASKKVTWKSSNTSVATVSTSGKVTAKKAGTAIITATANGKSAKCTVTVKSTANNLYKELLSKSYIVLSDGKIIYPNYFTIADIDKNGVKELLIRESDQPGGNFGSDVYIYTIISGKVKYTGSISNVGDAPRISSDGGIYHTWFGAGCANFWLASIKNGTLYNKVMLTRYMDASVTTYYLNNTVISKSQYEKELKKYEDSLKKEVAFQRNTAANRKRMLG